MVTTEVRSEMLMPVAVETLRCGESLEFDLYLRDTAGKPLLYRGQCYPIEEHDLKSLTERGIRTLYISADDVSHYEAYLRQLMFDDSVSGAVRLYAVMEANRSIFMEAMNSSNLTQVVNTAGDMASQLADVVCSQQENIGNLMKLLNHDYYTYTHVTNVCVYTTALASKLGINDRDELSSLAMGALLHDLGKRHVPPTILNKKGRLTDDEMAVVRRHPAAGFRELCESPHLTWPQLMMVYQHHERVDGRGYPVGIVGNEIHTWGKICAIADVYDALSSYRPYRGPMPKQELLEFFRNNAGKHFDAEMVTCWLEVLKEGKVA